MIQELEFPYTISPKAIFWKSCDYKIYPYDGWFREQFYHGDYNPLITFKK